MLSQWLQQARNGQSVWLSDVRRGCEVLPEHVAVTVQLTLCDGSRRDFSLPIPHWADGEQRQFVQQYVTAFVFNALSALSGREMAFYLDLRETEVVALLGELNDIFQVHKTARSGYGKTYALRQYAKLSRVAYIECDDTMSSRDLVEAIERSIGLPNGYGTIWRRVNGIREFFNTNKGYLLIIDEADKLVSKYTQKKMEILRAVFDQSDVGLVIAGEPKLEAQIKTYLVRMANRVDFYASLRGLSPSEVEGYLTDFQIEPEALVELKARACNMQTGCFRLLDRTLSNVRRILKETGEETVTVKTIAQASSMMML